MNSPIKICFCAIFRNESKNVYRCLDAAKPAIDYISICDTGSTDNTIELIKQWGIDNNIPTVVHNETFVNFGVSRTLSFTRARESFPDADYFLLLDADHILKFTDSWNRSELTAPSYIIKQVNPYIDYWNLRLIRADKEWRSVGVTHEFWTCPDFESNQLTSIWIYDQEDGGHKADKHSRDTKLLIEGIDDKNTPEDVRVRYYFYLAQTYRDLNQRKESIYWYDKRVAAGGWDQEVYIAQCEKANLLILEGADHDDIISEHLKAFTMRPSRAEALGQLSAYCRASERYAEGYIFSKIGKDIPLSDDILFVKRDVYEWKLLDDFAICSYWIGQYEESHTAGIKLLSLPILPLSEVERIKKNHNFTLQKLENNYEESNK